MQNFFSISRLRLSIFTALAGLVFTGFMYQSYSSKNHTQSSRMLRVGMLSADAPFMSINEVGQFEGFDVDVARAVSQKIGLNLEIIDMGLAELFIALDHGSIDMLMCGLSITQERLDKLAMIHYQGQGVSSYPLVFWQSIPRQIETIEDLRELHPTICVLPGTTQEKFLSQFDFISVKTMNSYPDIIMDLQYGKATAALFDSAVSSYLMKFPELQSVALPLGSFREFGHGIALRKGNMALVEMVSQAIDELKATGQIAEFERTWHMENS